MRIGMVKIFYPLLSNHLLIRDFCGTAVPRNPPSLFFIDPRVCIRCCFGIISGWIPYRHPPGRSVSVDEDGIPHRHPPGRAFRWMKTGFQTVIHQEGRFRGWKPGNAGADTRKAVSVDGSRKMNGQTPERPFPWMKAGKCRTRHRKGRFRGWKPGFREGTKPANIGFQQKFRLRAQRASPSRRGVWGGY